MSGPVDSPWCACSRCSLRQPAGSSARTLCRYLMAEACDCETWAPVAGAIRRRMPISLSRSRLWAGSCAVRCGAWGGDPCPTACTPAQLHCMQACAGARLQQLSHGQPELFGSGIPGRSRRARWQPARWRVAASATGLDFEPRRASPIASRGPSPARALRAPGHARLIAVAGLHV
jgi:hypothetical protein